ncbi:MAG: hypothetical protein AAFU54_27375 [Chloroflexota bacterium]
MKRHLPLLALITLFLAGAWTQGRVLPVLEGGDEWLQLAYAEHLRMTGTLPDRTASETAPYRQQAGQPPLTYALAALAMWGNPPIDTAQMYDDLQRDSNNWFTPPDRFNRRDNNNVFYLSNEPANTPEIVRAVRAARWVAPLYGVMGMVAAYCAGYEVFRGRRWALATAAVFAFTPMHVHVNSFLTTDGAAAAFGAVVVWQSVVMVRRGVTWWRSLVVGLVLGLGGLAKVNVLVLAPMVAVAVIVGVWRARHGLAPTVRRVVWHGVLIAVPLLLTFGVWALWGLLTYGDPFGTQTHRFPGQYFDPPLGVGAVLARLPEVYLSYWGKFGSAVYLHPVTYGALTVVIVVSVVGYILCRGMAWARHGLAPTGVVLLTAAGTMFAGLWYWVATINFITGRLMFPAHLAYVLIVVGGFYALARRFPVWEGGLRALLVVPVAVTGLVTAPMVVYAAYAPPQRILAEQDALFVFDETVRLTDYAAESVVIGPGEMAVFTLCWDVMAAPSRPAAYSLRIVKDGVPVGERTTVHGLGRYDWRQWQVGDAWCEGLEVPVGDVEPGTVYDVLLVLLDAQTGAVDWQATTADGTPVPFPVVGQVTGG